MNDFEEKPNSEELRLQRLFLVAASAQNETRKHAHQCEEFYYNDVDSTLSQFDKQQQDGIKSTFNIPVSTKLSYAIIEHMLSFLTGTKPSPRLISSSDATQEEIILHEQLLHATWYESQGNEQLSNAIRNSLVSGKGWLLVRKNSRYNESSTNVVVEYVPWKHFFIDPECKKSDLSDAEYVVHVDVIRKDKAEKLYDIKIPDEATGSDYMGYGTTDFDTTQYLSEYIPYNTKSGSKYKYVWAKTFYERKETTVYIGTNEFEEIYGIVSSEKPKPTTIPNPQIPKLQEQIDALTQQFQQAQQGVQQLQQQSESLQQDSIFSPDIQSGMQAQDQMQQSMGQMQGGMDVSEELMGQIQEMTIALKRLPKTIPAYIMIREGKNFVDNKTVDEEVIVTEVTKIKDIRILESFLVGNVLVEQNYIPCDQIPAIMLPFSWFDGPNKCYGQLHYFLDMVKAQNKYLSEIMYDVSVNAHRKGFIFETTIVEPSQFEAQMAQPNSLVRLRPDYQLADGGFPKFLEPSPINQSMQNLLEYFRGTIEYITGMNDLMRGDPSGAPQTMGATNSLQNFGAQRIKMYARAVESFLERVAYVIVQFHKAYAPRDKVVKYFDQDGNQNEVQILNMREDLKFKVRVEVVNALPSSRSMGAQLLGFIAQTAGDPALTTLLTEYMLKTLDIPESKEIASKMDALKQAQQQLAQLQQQVDQLQKQNNTISNQIVQQKSAAQVEQATAEAKQNIAVNEAQAVAEQNAQGQEQQTTTPLF